MSFLLDTDVVSSLEKKRVPPRLSAWMAQNEQEVFLSVVTFAELEFGLRRAPATHQPSLRAWLENLRRCFAHATEPLDEAVLVRWKTLLAELEASRRTLTCEDSLIAATALTHGHILVTHNPSHFEPCGLTAVDPLAGTG